MPGECQEVDPAFLHVHRDRPRALSRIHRKEKMPSPADLPNLPDRKDGSADIRRMEHDNRLRIPLDRPLYGLRMYGSVFFRRHRVIRHTAGFHLPERTHDCIMFQSGYQYMIPLL